ncbi:hypothetical protein SAMN05216328_1292 [Ensifer sp. YR511]|nr:hypothetical protein SAMN05216328_1292 [Ensifer sp. YR511]
MTERRQMDASEIVFDVLEVGCDICAVGHDSYVIGEIDEQTQASRMELPPKDQTCSGLRLRVDELAR